MNMESAAVAGQDIYLEREMNKHQRGLIDACFEEGHYESGISVLQQLRSTKYKPSSTHVRQLLYIALYPPPAPIDKGKEKAKTDWGSPSKIPPAKQKKSPLLPTPPASEAAICCLASLALTNSPGALFRAVPCYPPPGTPAGGGVHEMGDEDEDSFISREAASIKQCRNCWAVLQEGFVKRKEADVSVDKARGKTRRKARFEEEDMHSGDDGLDTPAVVGQYAWPVLEWYIAIFEKDEALTESSGLPRHSPLLLSQIPPARSSTGVRWEADTPLDIVFHCFAQTQPPRRLMGARLMTLLINLTSTMYFDAAIFTSTVFARLISEGPGTFPEFFSILPSTATATRFKLALCNKYLGSSSDRPTESSLRPKPQGRVQPRPTRRRAGDPSMEASPSKLRSGEAQSASVPESIARKLPLPASSEILHLLRASTSSQPDTDTSDELRVKFELLLTYGILQAEAPPDDKDPDWHNMLHDGRVRQALDHAFEYRREGVPGDQQYVAQSMKELLVGMIGTW